MADSLVRAPVAVEFQATGVEEVRRGLRLVKGDIGEAGASTEQFAVGARRMSFALEEMARSGEVAGRGLRELVATGGEMALSFGEGGPLVAAVAVLGLAFIDHFRRAREEIQKTEEQFKESFDRMVNAGDVQGLTKQAQDIFVGTPAKHFEDGIAAMERKLDELKAKAKPDTLFVGTGPGGVAQIARPFGVLTDDITALNTKLEEARKRFNELAQAIQDTKNVPKVFGPLDAVKVTAGAADRVPATPPGLDEDFIKRLKDVVPVIGEIGDASKSLASQLNDETSVLLREYSATTTTQQRRLEIEQKLVEILKQQAEIAPRIRVPVPNVTVTGGDKFLPDWAKGAVPAWRKMGEALGDALSTGVGAGLRAAISSGNIAAGFRALTGSVLAGLGSVIERLGEQALAAAILANTALKSIFTPAGIAASLGLIALGVSLQALGGAAGGGGGGGGGGGYGGGSYTSSLPQIIDRGFINPAASSAGSGVQARPSITVPILAINPNDPASKRLAQELVRNASQRGDVRGGA